MTSPRTLADRQEYLEAGLVPVECAACGTWVRVKKLSRQQTTVQWTRPAVLACVEFADPSDDRPNALIPTCTQLRASIDRAVRDGRLEIT